MLFYAHSFVGGRILFSFFNHFSIRPETLTFRQFLLFRGDVFYIKIRLHLIDVDFVAPRINLLLLRTNQLPNSGNNQKNCEYSDENRFDNKKYFPTVKILKMNNKVDNCFVKINLSSPQNFVKKNQLSSNYKFLNSSL